MAALKTQPTDADVNNFIKEFANTEQKQADSFALVKLMQEVTGCSPVMWGPPVYTSKNWPTLIRKCWCA